MGSEANRWRRKWQDYSGKHAGEAEQDFYQAFSAVFENTEYIIRRHPDDFKNIYLQVKLDSQELAEIYNPAEKISQHGIYPDYAISNQSTNKTIYVEVKRQDGWVEDGTRADGRGNAHERSNKYFTPGLQKTLRKRGNLHNDTLPFWVVFQGNITRDPCRVREIKLWYTGYEAHYFFWRDTTNPETLIKHFQRFIAPLIS